MPRQASIGSVEPTVFFVRGEGDSLRHLVRVAVTSEGDSNDAEVALRWQGGETTVALGPVAAGSGTYDAYFPDIRTATALTVSLLMHGRVQDERTLDWKPTKHWEVHMRMFSHHDVGYTDLPSRVLLEFDGFMDDVLGYCRHTECWPWESRCRYLIEQSFSMVNYVRHRPRAVVEELVHFIKNGQIELTGLFANMTSELCGHEQMIRLLYPSARLKREFGFDVVSATHNDIPGFSWGYAGVLAGSGVRYFTPGIPRWYFGPPDKPAHPLWDEKRVLKMSTPGAFWWEAADGQRVLLYYDWHGGEWHPSSYDEAMRQLPDMLRQADADGYAYEVIGYMLRGGLRDNAPLSDRYAFLVRRWNAIWAYPRLINSTNAIFMTEFERRYGTCLPTQRGEVPGTDYSLSAACTAKETATNRRAHDMLLTAERLATLAMLRGGYDYPAAMLDDAYEESFYYDEHCWGMHGSGGLGQDASFAEKSARAYRAAALAEDVAWKAANRLADGIAYPRDGYYVTVFNPLPYVRGATVRLNAADWPPCSSPMYWRPPRQEGDGPMQVSGLAIGRDSVTPPLALLAEPFDLIDVETGQRVPYQLATVADPQAPEPWAAERVAKARVDARFGQVLTFLAEDLPPLGYRTYEVVPRPTRRLATGPGRVSRRLLENDHFRLEFDRSGQLSSLYDKGLERELLDEAAPHPFGRLFARDCATAEVDLGRVTEVQVGERGPLYSSLVLRGEVRGCPRWTQELRLYHREKRLDVATRVLRDSTPNLEFYFGFPFAVEAPRFRFESANTVIEPTVDQLPGSNTDYYAVQHWADVSSAGGDWGITWTSLDAPMAEFGGLWPGYVSWAHHGVTGPGWGHPFLEPGQIDKGHIYSAAMYNNFRTNFYNVRDGEMLFRYSMTTHRGDWRDAAVSAFGWGVAMPPLPVWMKGPQSGPLPPASSFMVLDGADGVTLLALKPAEDGRGLIVRLLERRGEEVDVLLRLPLIDIVQAYRTNLIEEDEEPIPTRRHEVRVHLAPFGFATVRVMG